jgi:hypothetical protein
LKLSKSMGKLSCVNETCDHLIEHITKREAQRLHLPHLREGRTWVTLSLMVSPGRSWLIYARYAPSSVYPENILCMHHAVVRGAVIDATANPPRMRFHDSVFELHRRDPGLDGALYLQLPLDPCGLFMPTFQQATFLPSDHWLYLRSMNNGAAERIARLAGLDDPRAMEFWVDRFLTYDDELPPWLLADLVNVRHHRHIPQQLRTHFRVGNGTEDEPNEPAIEPGGAL